MNEEEKVSAVFVYGMWGEEYDNEKQFFNFFLYEIDFIKNKKTSRKLRSFFSGYNQFLFLFIYNFI